MKLNANTLNSPQERGLSSNLSPEPPGPVLKGWMIRVLHAAEVVIPPDGAERERLAWLGVEMQRFLTFSRAQPAGTSIADALQAYGLALKARQPAPESWRLDQVREALRAFRKGSEGWEIIDGPKGPEVKFRAKSRAGADDGYDLNDGAEL